MASSPNINNNHNNNSDSNNNNLIPKTIGRLTDLSVSADHHFVVVEGDKGLCVVPLITPDKLNANQQDKDEVEKEIEKEIEDGESVFGRMRVVGKAKSYEASKLAMSPHPSRLSWAASSSGSSIVLWDLAAARPLIASIPAHQRTITGLCWSKHSSDIVVTSSLDASIKIWDVRSPKAARSLTVKTYIASQSHVEWSPHSANLLASSHGGEVKLWDLRLPSYPQTLPADVAQKEEAEEHILLTCAKDKAIKVWNTEKSPSQKLYTVPMNFPVQSAMFLPHSPHHIITSHSSHPSLYLWDSESTGYEPLFSLPMGNDPIVAFDFQLLPQAGVSSDHTCVIAITRDFFLRKWPIPNDITQRTGPFESPHYEGKDSHCEEIIPLDLAHEFSRAVQTPKPGIKIEESSSANRSLCVSFTSKRLGEFRLRISFPTLYPHGAAPRFDFLVPSSSATEHERIEIIRHLSAIADGLVATHKLCLQPCLEALSIWTRSNIADIIDPHPPTPVIGGMGTIFTSPTVTSTKSRARARSLPPQMDTPLAEKKKPQSPLPPIDGQQLWVFKHTSAEAPADSRQEPLNSMSTLAEDLVDSHHVHTHSIHSELLSHHTRSEPQLKNPSKSTPDIPIHFLADNDKGSSKPIRRNSLSQSDVVKQDMIYWSPTFCVGDIFFELVQIFEPSVEDPLVIQGGILQFQLCISLSQICSLKLYRTQHDFKLKLKSIKHQHTQEQEKEEGGFKKSITAILEFNKGKEKVEVEAHDISDKGPTIYPCMEIVVLHSRRMQTIYLGHLLLAKVEPLFNQIKKRVAESRAPSNPATPGLPTISETSANSSPSGSTSSLLSSSLPQNVPQNQITASLIPPTVGSLGHTPVKDMMLRASTGSPMPSYLTNTQILDPVNVKRLRSCLPPRFHSVDWDLLYSSELDGISINTFYANVRNAAPSLLLVEDTNGHIFEAWREDAQGYYGTGESFLFKLSPEFGVYRWSRKNDFFMCSTPNWLAVGGSNTGFGLHLDAEFDCGTSSPSTTFDSPSLSSTQEFKCSVLEAWGFIS